MKEGNRIVPDGPGDIIIQEEIERQKEIDKKLDPEFLPLKKGKNRYQKIVKFTRQIWSWNFLYNLPDI